MKRPWGSLWLTALLLLLLSCQAAIRKGPGETVILGREDLSGVAGADLEAKIARDLVTLRNVIQGLTELEQRMSEMTAALGRRGAGSYTQAEDNRIRALLQSYLNYRSVLLRLLGYYSSFETVPREDLSLKAFLLAYGSGLMLFREGILLVTTFRDHPPARAKLNEPEPVWGIPSGIFEMVYSNITSSTNVRLLGEAWDHYSTRLPLMAQYGLTEGSEFAWLHETVRVQQRFIEENAVNIWVGKWDILWRRVHALGRRPTYNAVALMGTFTSQAKIWISQPLITPVQVQALKRDLQPGDIILERRNWYLSNGFLPGFWPHMALYIGTPEELEARGLLTHPLVQRHLEHYRRPDRMGHERRVIEAVASGVIFSSLEEMAAADHLAVLRPRVSEARKNAAIVRAFSHYGKPYDFDFDFFSTDKLVCTELVYRAYDETLEGERVGLPLVRFLGRDTLPPDEVVRMFAREHALDRQGEALGSPPRRQLEFVLFLDGDLWSGQARSAGVEDFIRSAERPVPPPAAEGPVGGRPGP
jgi:hypothetical protein